MTIRATPTRILPFTITRAVLTGLADALPGLEKHEAKEVLHVLAGEIDALLRGEVDALVWQQAAMSLSDRQNYGLQRIGLLPQKKDDP